MVDVYALFLFYIISCIYRWRMVYNIHYICTIFIFILHYKVVFIGGEWCICTIFNFNFSLKVVFLGGEWCICTIFFNFTL